jgi:hypothetical protein
MEPLPYFLLLLKQNVLLCSIIATGSLAQVDLSQVEHVTHSGGAVDLLNFSLSETDKFASVNVLITETGTNLIFHTSNSDYFDHPERYFQRGAMERKSAPYVIFGQEVRARDKNLGKFEFLGPAFPTVPPASVSLRHSNLYGYVVSINFYKHNLPLPYQQHPLPAPVTD